MTKATPTSKRSRRAPARRPAAKAKAKAKAKPRAKVSAKSKVPAKSKAPAAKPPRAAAPKRAPKRAAKPPRSPKSAAAKPPRSPKSAAAGQRTAGTKWPKFVEQHGVVLASARGPVPCVAEAVAGEPIIGSWWSHPEAHAIFDALSAIDDSADIRCFKLIDHKITFVHRRLWPALACLARAGVLEPDRVASIQQEHMPTGEHRNITTPFPDWLPDDPDPAAAASLSVDEARAQLGPWL